MESIHNIIYFCSGIHLPTEMLKNSEFSLKKKTSILILACLFQIFKYIVKPNIFFSFYNSMRFEDPNN